MVTVPKTEKLLLTWVVPLLVKGNAASGGKKKKNNIWKLIYISTLIIIRN